MPNISVFPSTEIYVHKAHAKTTATIIILCSRLFIVPTRRPTMRYYMCKRLPRPFSSLKVHAFSCASLARSATKSTGWMGSKLSKRKIYKQNVYSLYYNADSVLISHARPPRNMLFTYTIKYKLSLSQSWPYDIRLVRILRAFISEATARM